MPAATRREQWTLRRAVARRPDTLSIASFPGGYLGQAPQLMERPVASLVDNAVRHNQRD
ncbi:hypothetical protein ACFTY8_21255 [Streptomyces mirabilis]|uniref:hypothetical protein n=1 Tax=Streptomyces mirabilis TaxID=68239 RepID=UPI00363719CD